MSVKLILCITGNESKITSSLQGILYGLYCLAPFIFLLLLSIGTRSTLAKIWGDFSPRPPNPFGFYGPEPNVALFMMSLSFTDCF